MTQREKPHRLDLDFALTDETAYSIAEDIRANPTLREFRLSEQDQLSRTAQMELIDAALSCPHLKKLYLRKLNLDAPALKHICEGASQISTLHSLDLSKNDLSQNLGDINAMLGSKQNWRLLRFMECGLDEVSITSMARSLGEQPDLCRFHMQMNLDDSKTYPAISEALIATGSTNLLSAIPSERTLEQYMAANKAKSDDIYRILTTRDDEAPLTVAQNVALTRQLPSIEFLNRHQGGYDTCLNYLGNIPTWKGNSAEALLAPKNYALQCAAENPQTWHNPEKVLDAADRPIQAFIEQRTPLGESLLDCGIICNPRGMVLALNHHQVQLRHDALLDDAGKKTPLFEKMIEQGSQAALFTKSNWKGASPRELQTVLGALTPDERATIPGRHVLMNQLESDRRNNREKDEMGR